MSISPPAMPSDSLSAERAAASSSSVAKATANALFAGADYDAALAAYAAALDALGASRLHFEAAVLHSNVAACHLKLAAWESAVAAATDALAALARALPSAFPKAGAEEEEGGGQGSVKESTKEEAEEGDAEQQGEDDKVELEEESVPPEQVLEMYGHTPQDVERMRAKSLLRRATARSRLGGWAALQGADEDYKELANMPQLAPLDRAAVQKALRELPAKLEEAKQKEIGDMTAKLKQLGNGILKPFGLSTDNFAMVKDENTGGYSIRFNQNK